MFSEHYLKLDSYIRELINKQKSTSFREICDLLEKQESSATELSLENIMKLLNVDLENDVASFNLIRQFTKRNNSPSNFVNIISPIYLSSHCIDTCGYCAFSANKTNIQRTKLSLDEAMNEVNAVMSQGSEVIEFTLATDPNFTPEVLAKYISATKKLLDNRPGSGVLLCSDHFKSNDYEKLKHAGLWAMVQWDETLNIAAFEKWHKNSPRKGDFWERINTHDYAIKAGLQVATGCLFGLSDYKYDVLMQIAKSRYLKQEYGVKPFVFGTPRLKSIMEQQLHPKYEVNDKQYELALMIYKLAEPQIARWLQTRETPELNLRNIVDGDIYTYACGNVKPGGYTINKTCKGGQFKVNDLGKKQVEEELNVIGFSTKYSWIKIL